ncbi:MAG TPA: BTAD domain-containing putative transcriptional regulator [Lapillicoccus sp.]|nr:BTAD domain-containing putative transcriptional regulator [Lapillicoccus sp.]
MRVFVFGAARVEGRPGGPEGETTAVDIGARKPRSIVAALAMTPGRAVSPGLLADLVWAGEPPPAAHGALHAYISGLRKALEPDRRAGAAGAVLATTDHGYVLAVPPADIDVHRFAAEVRAAERGLAPLASQLGDGDRAGWPTRTETAALVERLDEALAAWRGEPYADLPDHPDVLAERAALERLRVAAEESRLVGLLALGEHASVLSTAESAIAREPLRERLRAVHAVALLRSGRQVEALDALRGFRELLVEDTGLDPGPELVALERAVLRQDPALTTRLADPVASARPAERQAPAPAPAPTAAPDVGRDGPRAELRSLLDRVGQGSSGLATVLGEPGIGKSWLVRHLAEEAARHGVCVAAGACSQDDGAPPLWPWLDVLRALDAEADLADLVDTAGNSGPGQVAFQTWDRIARSVLAASRERPVLVVLDDLHWADEATLRALRHLVAVTPDDVPLAVVATRRLHPEPSGALADVAEAFARRHALRIELSGLDAVAAEALVRAVTENDVDAGTVEAWRRRSEGNPFFLVELARLGSRGDAVPATVRDVLTRRLESLPVQTTESLRAAAVVGRAFRVETVAAARQREVDDVEADLEPAQAAGVVVDLGADGFAFTHALTHEAVALTLSPRRRSRLHAQVAHALETDDGLRVLYSPDELTAELARHWLAGGPTHADRAWRAAVAAADQARRATAYAEALQLRRDALASHERVVGAGLHERYELLLELARDSAYAAWWPTVSEASYAAMALARTLDRPDLVGPAAAGLTRYCVWTIHDWMELSEDGVDDLRWALRALPEDDSPERCMLLLSLAVELYYDPTAVAERTALVDAGLELARRLADPALLSWASRAAWLAIWSPSHTSTRLHLDHETLAAARATGDLAAQAVALLALATDGLEMSGPEAWEAPAREAEEIAERERLSYVLWTLNWVEMSLAALRSEPDEADRRRDRVLGLARSVALPIGDIEPVIVDTIRHVWAPRPDDAEVGLLIVDEDKEHPGPGVGLGHGLLARVGDAELLRQSMTDHPLVQTLETWATPMLACFEVEAASLVGDAAVARRWLRVLEPLAGRMALAGVSLVFGPVDGYLALAQATTGDTAAAARLADRALEQADAWRLPAYRSWLLGRRARLGF